MRIKLNTLTGGDPVPAGPYNAALVKAVPTDFENSGSWGFKVQFKVLDGEFENRRVFENFVILDKNGEVSPAIFRFAQFVTVAAGNDVEVDLSDAHEVTAALDACIDVPVKVRVDVENDNKGLPRNRIAGYES